VRYPPSQFPATILRTRAAGDFHFTETRYAPNAVIEPHAHERACLVVVVDGTFDEETCGRRWLAEPESVIVRPAGEVHCDLVGGGGRCLNVELPVGLGVAPALVARHERAAELCDAFQRGDDTSIEPLILSMIVGRVPPSWLMAVRRRLHESAANRLTLDDLGDFAGVHPVHLAATFQRFYGVPVASYLRRVRLESACRELAESDAPIADVALASGFADQSHFGRTLKRHLGVTPAAYRAARRSP